MQPQLTPTDLGEVKPITKISQSDLDILIADKSTVLTLQYLDLSGLSMPFFVRKTVYINHCICNGLKMPTCIVRGNLSIRNSDIKGIVFGDDMLITCGGMNLENCEIGNTAKWFRYFSGESLLFEKMDLTVFSFPEQIGTSKLVVAKCKIGGETNFYKGMSDMSIILSHCSIDNVILPQGIKELQLHNCKHDGGAKFGHVGARKTCFYNCKINNAEISVRDADYRFYGTTLKNCILPQYTKNMDCSDSQFIDTTFA